MAQKIIESETHNYEPVNKYIDERARLRRTRSVWGYTRSFALFLIALGIFLILAAYAYHIFKKPYPLQLDEISQQLNENINKEIINKNDQIEKVENNIKENPENEELKQQLKELQKEKDEILKKLEEQNQKLVDGKIIKYNRETLQFDKSPKIDGFVIWTRRTYPTTNDLLEQTGNYEETCYITKENTSFEYDHNYNSIAQTKALTALDLTLDQAKSYEEYCQRTK